MNLAHLNADQIAGESPVFGNLWVKRRQRLPQGFAASVAGDLVCFSGSVPKHFRPSVDGNVWMWGVRSIGFGFAPKCTGKFFINGLLVDPEVWFARRKGLLW